VTGDLSDFQYAVGAPLALPPTRIVAVHGSRVGDPPMQRIRLGEALVQAGVITQAQLESCLRFQEANTPRRRLGAVVVELGLATDVHVAQGLGTILGFDYVDPSGIDVPVEVARKLPRLSAEMLGAVPVAAGPSWLRVAVSDPTDRYTVEALREASGVVNISLAVATPRAIEAALHRFWAPEYNPVVVRPVAAVPDLPVEEPAEEAPEPAVAGGWEYTFVGDGLPSNHPGYAGDLAGTERALARLGADGWEAVGVQASGSRMTVLLKRAR
jgi:hypothetical protein